ncbi:MAG TPA: hypothetical protein VGH23_05810 [Rhizomicrobium sp.]|jgi:hypothetical protein
MIGKALSRFGMQVAIGLVLLFAVREALNRFELLAGVPVDQLLRSIVICAVCVLLPRILLHFYEIRRRA